MLCAIISTGVKPLTILTVDIALKSRKVTQYQAKHVTLAWKWKWEVHSLLFWRLYRPEAKRPVW